MPLALTMIGAPVTSVRTPPLLLARLQELGVEATMAVEHVEPEELEAFCRRAREQALDGMVVTMPLKQAMMRFLDRQTEACRLIGSVNTVRRSAEGEWVGAQFDGVGLVNAVRARAIALRSGPILLLGAGGAGNAIGVELARAGCREVRVCDLRPAAAAALVDKMNAIAGHAIAAAAASVAPGFGIVINASSQGMKADDASPVAADLIDTGTTVVDIVADPIDTALARLARARGATLVSGREMVQGMIDPIARWLISDAREQ